MQTITVDMTPGFRQPTIHYSQNDVGTTFAIDLRSRFGDTLPASPTVKIQATKPSGFGFSIEADSVVDSVATFTTVATMTDEAGRFLAELEVSDSGVVLYTANFYMEGEANPHPIGTTDGSQETIIPTLTLLVERVEAAAASVLDMTVNATTLAAGSQATYSYDEDTNTATFGIPQGEAGAGAAGVTASAYSSSSTYAVGDYVIHNSNLYRCTMAITTAEAFTAAHWTQVVLGDDVANLKSDLSGVENLNISSTSFTWIDGDLGPQGQDATYANYKRTDEYIPASLLEITMNGATTLYACYYDSAKAFISKVSITTDTTIDPANITGCAYYRFATKNTNLALLEFKGKSDIVMATDTLQNFVSDITYSHSIRLADNYERGTIVSSSGELAGYGGFTNFRTGKYLRIKRGSNITATFSNGSMYVAKYAKDKSYIGMVRIYSATETAMGKDTAYLRIEHDGYSIGDTVTLAFKSNDAVPYWGYGRRVNGNTISFGYQVYPCFETDTPTSVTTLPTTNVFTSGVLMLPPNYKEDGEKVPIIYFAHGSADYFAITDTEFSSSYMDYLHYLRDEGYALFDCYGWTNYYTISGAQMANPTNMAAIKQGLKWVADHYNVDINKVYVTGKSLGGLQAINMCYEGDFHIKACCPLAPALDATEIGFGYDVASRKSYAQDLHFSEDTQGVLDEVWSGVLAEASAEYKAYAKANADKLLGYNPLWRNLIDADAEELIQFQIDGEGGTGAGQGLPNKIKTMMRICPTPTKIICAVDDNAVSYGLCEAYVQSIKNCGGLAEMRALPANTGKHHAVDNADAALKVSSITTKCGVTYSNVPLAYAEMVQYFRRFS